MSRHGILSLPLWSTTCEASCSVLPTMESRLKSIFAEKHVCGHLMTTNARKNAIWKTNSDGCKLCVQYTAVFSGGFFAGSLLHRKSLFLPCQSRATHQPVSHRFAPNPLTVLQTAEMDAYTVESMKLKGKSLINWQQAPQDREAGDGMINLTWGWSAGAAEERLMDVQQGRMFGCKRKKKNVRCIVCSLFHLGFACLYCVHTFSRRGVI